MGLTNFPDGISGIGGAAIPGYVSDTTGNAKAAAGTSIITGGSVSVATGLTTVNYVVAGAYGLLAGTADFDQVSAQPATGGTIVLRSQSTGGTASVSAGTATWIAWGT